MVGVNFFGNFDLASAAIWGFYLFFAGLIFYIQRENMREGYPLENDDGSEAANQGPYPVPEDKTFHLPHGRGELTVPSGQQACRSDLALRQTADANGFPFEPTGNPMLDGVGPASWATRRDEPELDAHGHPKIVPMAAVEDFFVSAGRDPRGMTVYAGDGEAVGTVSDLWIDAPEQFIRYLEIALDSGVGEGVRLVPMTLAKMKRKGVQIHSIYSGQFADVPTTASPRQVTKLEEDKISGYYGGGKLYADVDRLEPQV